MRCRMVQRKLELLETQELSDSERDQVQSHLESCGPCRSVQERRQKLQKLLVSVPVPPVPDQYAAMVVARVKKRQAIAAAAQRRRSVPKQSIWTGFEYLTGTAAALAIGLLIGVLMGYDTWQNDRQQSVAIAARSTDPLAESGFQYLVESREDSLAQDYLRLLSDFER
ncbi:hypothetical protein Q31b_46250 [Novipirellula aureliae]|uniref:Putative zinc-finger domain-containing protein n=1 Tax=Novipirellula aureliae TaxID=2527966 RepID=A0A5C6DS19_9BACT|nr:zf-HC2 domain-containing protein [Novipirellula aureliae]TWU37836.1 hypothetical protein Q31b_46250 [Novipirellula aureliae]